MGTGNRGVRSGLESCGFILVEPKELGNAGETAKKLAGCSGVEKVHVTSGKYGFIVAAKADSDGNLKTLGATVKRVTRGKSVSVAISHLVYG